MPGPKYGRILLKLSGEVLAGKQEFGIDTLVASRLASEIKTIHELNVTIGLIIGAGNIFVEWKLLLKEWIVLLEIT